jgi:hypothetical protein
MWFLFGIPKPIWDHSIYWIRLVKIAFNFFCILFTSKIILNNVLFHFVESLQVNEYCNKCSTISSWATYLLLIPSYRLFSSHNRSIWSSCTQKHKARNWYLWPTVLDHDLCWNCILQKMILGSFGQSNLPKILFYN